MRRFPSSLAMPAAMALAGLLALPAGWGEARAAPRDLLKAVVGVHAEVPGEARTADTLGRERQGTGVVIDGSGLVLTIGYLVVEAVAVDLRDAGGHRIPADVVAYDHETGFGLLRATAWLDAVPVPLGDSGTVEVGQPLLVLSNMAGLDASQTKLVDRREFAGYWEYLLEDALFTTPPHAAFGGAALIDAGGRLVGIGSLGVPDAAGPGLPSPGNMFVPIDALKPLLGDLLTLGRRDGPGRPWLGLTSREVGGKVLVARVAEGAPAAQAGIAPGDVILGVGGQPISGLADFYRKVWGTGDPGVQVPLQVIRRGGAATTVHVTSTDRLRWLRLRPSY
jgi:S1-C subfamily serine protease